MTPAPQRLRAAGRASSRTKFAEEGGDGVPTRERERPRSCGRLLLGPFAFACRPGPQLRRRPPPPRRRGASGRTSSPADALPAAPSATPRISATRGAAPRRPPPQRRLCARRHPTCDRDARPLCEPGAEATTGRGLSSSWQSSSETVTAAWPFTIRFTSDSSVLASVRPRVTRASRSSTASCAAPRMTDANDVVWEDGGGAHRSRLRGAAPAGRPDMHRPVPSRPTRDDDRRASRPPRDPGNRDDDHTAFELVIESPAASNDKENARPTRDEDDDGRGRRRDGRDDADDASARKALRLRSANANNASMRRIGSLHKDNLSLRRVESDASLTRGSGGSALEAGAFASDSTKREGKLWERDDDDDATEGRKPKRRKPRSVRSTRRARRTAARWSLARTGGTRRSTPRARRKRRRGARSSRPEA